MARHHKFVIIGGGTAGITVAARLRRAGERDIAVIDPSEVHYYQPLWTLVGGGLAPAGSTARPEVSVMPKDVTWIKDAAMEIDPDDQWVGTAASGRVGYDFLIVCPGIQLDWGDIPGVAETLGQNGVSSNYRVDLAPRTWEFMQATTSGTAVFAAPSGAIKCAGAPQKIAYLAADYFRRQGRSGVKVMLVLPGAKIFGVPEFAATLMQVIDRYGIDLRLESEVIEVNHERNEAIVLDRANDEKYAVEYSMLHVVPPQSAPDWVKATPLASADPKGWVDVDKHTMQHVRHHNVFSLGDASSTPNSKTGAAIRKQAPVVVENVLAVAAGREPSAEYHGYSSCPIVTAHNRMLLCEFDYSVQKTPSIPVIDTTKERYDMWLLKRYGLPALYWHGMLKGLA
ncbi:MAG: NAD(P)/FAD-dependent oxidoreductase [Ilumatobacteraceae bacterium]|jgi:sulfide:quinone oxidoreductase|nr:NAD(P)/FAD-dependent oxidoreductase [Ilumatobacteraceae bacterium]